MDTSCLNFAVSDWIFSRPGTLFCWIIGTGAAVAVVAVVLEIGMERNAFEAAGSPDPDSASKL